MDKYSSPPFIFIYKPLLAFSCAKKILRVGTSQKSKRRKKSYKQKAILDDDDKNSVSRRECFDLSG